MNNINEIFNKLENRQITFEQARKMVLDIVPQGTKKTIPDEKFNGELHFRHMIENGQLQKENRELTNFIEEERDFWEWYEGEYGETRKEVWEKYEKFRDEQDGVNELTMNVID